MEMIRNGEYPTTITALPPPDTGPRVIRRQEAADRLACCVRVIDRLAQEGKLRRVKLPGRTRAAGFLESDVYSLLADKEAA
jgi:hypothetical protein